MIKTTDVTNNDIGGCTQFNGECAKVMRVIFQYNMGKVRIVTNNVLTTFEKKKVKVRTVTPHDDVIF